MSVQIRWAAPMATDIIGRPLLKGTFVLYTTATRSNKITLGILREDIAANVRIDPNRGGTCKVLAVEFQIYKYDRNTRDYVELQIPKVSSRKTTLHHIPAHSIDPHGFVPFQVLPEVLEMQRTILEN